MNKPSLSAVIANYNYGRFIGQALDAILSQSFPAQEVIVVDDCSTDDSVDIIRSYIQRYPVVRLISHERNMGAVFTCNHGLQEASGDYVYSGSSDDVVLPELFEKSMRLLMENPQAGLCSSLSLLMDDVGRRMGTLRTPVVLDTPGFIPPSQVMAKLMRYGLWVKGNTTVYRRDAILRVGGYLSDLGPYCDSFAAQVIVLRHGACYLPEPLAVWRRADSGYASTVASDPEKILPYMRNVGRLMQTTYLDLFIGNYAQRWLKYEIYELMRRLHVKHELCFTRFTKWKFELEPLNISERICFVLMKIFGWWETAVMKLFLFSRLRKKEMLCVFVKKMKSVLTRGVRFQRFMRDE